MASLKYAILPGQVYTRLTVLSSAGLNSARQRLWKCRCECGNITYSSGPSLGTGRAKSCGCLNREKIVSSVKTHGMTDSRLYSIWKNLRRRCDNPKSENYHRYGGRGITYHPSFATFEGFLDNIPAGYRDDLEIDRIDNDGNYEPGNLKWSTRKEQLNNTSRNRKYLSQDGESSTLQTLSERYGIPRHILGSRLTKNNGDVADAITRPVKRVRPRLSDDVVRNIRNDLYSMTKQDIADWYNVTVETIRDIASGRTYGNVK